MGRRDHDPRDTRRGGLIGKGIRGLASGVGLVSESISAHKEEKAAKKAAAAAQADQQAGTSNTSHQEASADHGARDLEMTDAPPTYDEGNPDTGAPTYPDDKKRKTYPDDKKRALDDGQSDDDEDAGEPDDNLDEQWELDDAQVELAGEPAEKPATKSNRELEDEFILAHPVSGPRGELPLPVILPQRRPKNRARGFIRAYAPVLENCGIDQPTWLSFLDLFQKSSAASPWINAINLAQFATIAIGSHGIGIAVGYAISKFADAMVELQSRERTSNFLFKMNEEYFRPRGLYCLVMTYDPHSYERIASVNLADTIASRSNPAEGIANIPNKFRNADGTTRHDWEFPECAPLVFPTLDEIATQTGTEAAKEQSSMKQKMGFVTSYLDKRATAEYAMKHPDSVLAKVPQAEFKSRYADPKNAAASGSLIAFLSGGKLVPNPRYSRRGPQLRSRGLVGGLIDVAGQAIRGEEQGSGWKMAEPQQEYLAHQMQDRNYRWDQYSRGYGGRSRGTRRGQIGLISTPVGAAKKLLKSNVLYLMVVNMPTEEEMAQARAL